MKSSARSLFEPAPPKMRQSPSPNDGSARADLSIMGDSTQPCPESGSRLQHQAEAATIKQVASLPHLSYQAISRCAMNVYFSLSSEKPQQKLAVASIS